jgi:hypothetical protein
MGPQPFDATIVPGAAWRDSALEITYDGTAPPTALFEDLRAIGWVPPVPAPPPAAAIDWSRPDPVTGTRYTLRPYEAMGRALPGPQAQDLAALEEVLARHRPAPAAPEPQAPPAPAAPAPTASPDPVAGASEPPRAHEREVQIGATLDEARAVRVRDALTERGLTVRSTRMSLASPGGFRGSVAGAEENAVRLQLRAPLSQVDEVVAILGPYASDVVVRR